MDRRRFLRHSTEGLLATAALSSVSRTGVSQDAGAQPAGVETKRGPNERVRVGVIGGGGRALSLNRTFAASPQAEVVAIADLDPRRLPQAVEDVTARQGKRPRTTNDFRHLIDDNSIDIIVVGTPDHWHAIPTILACLAGKDVYVEKPDAHNIVEGERMVAAMRKHNRIVQLGSQHRSTTRLQTAMDYVRSGALGRCLVAKAWESGRQGPIGFPPDGPAPPGVDYDFWLGSAPKRPFNPNRFHGNWRWFFDYGTGDLGNDGVHRLDMAVACLSAACEAQGDEPLGLPERIQAVGGKWYFDDAQEFPDTLQVNYQYAGGGQPKILTYEMRIWAPYSMEGETEGAAVYGDKGYLVIGNNGWRAYGERGRLVEEGKGGSHEGPHVENFLDCVKSRQKPFCDLETIGQPASILCHAGNLSARLGRQLDLQAETLTFKDDEEANAMRGRSEWRAPWTLPEV